MTTRYVRGQKVVDFVYAAFNRKPTPPYVGIGTEIDGEIVNGVVLNVWTGNDAHVTLAGKKFSKGFLAVVGHYAYQSLGCIRLTAITEQVSIVRYAERLGGEVEGLLRNHFGPGRDAIVIGILKEDWERRFGRLESNVPPLYDLDEVERTIGQRTKIPGPQRNRSRARCNEP